VNVGGIEERKFACEGALRGCTEVCEEIFPEEKVKKRRLKRTRK